MSLVEHLRRLFLYDGWANREVLASLKSISAPPSRSIQLFAHIFSAERLWLERLQAKKQSLPVWPDFTLHQCEKEAVDLPLLWEQYLDTTSEADLLSTMSYKNSQGESWSSRKEDVLLHVVMHSSYHRGQIASDTRAAGSTPAYTDFIHAVRQGLVE